nr:immunoglobulin light chain junction region [Macaca mulatta]
DYYCCSYTTSSVLF